MLLLSSPTVHLEIERKTGNLGMDANHITLTMKLEMYLLLD